MKRMRLKKKLTDKERRLLRIGELFPPVGKDIEVYNKASVSEKLKLLKKWQKEKGR
jgi:hypothetical protein